MMNGETNRTAVKAATAEHIIVCMSNVFHIGERCVNECEWKRMEKNALKSMASSVMLVFFKRK